MKRELIILGVGMQHDAGAVIIRDGEILAAVNEERLNRIKMFWGFPELSIREVIALAGIKPTDIDYVAVANTTFSTPGGWKKYRTEFRRRLVSFLSRCGLARILFGTQLGIWGYRLLNHRCWRIKKRRELVERIRKMGIKAPLIYIDHHEAHSASAYYTSGWERCLIITLDSIGDGFCSTVSLGRDGRMIKIHQVPFYHSPGFYYIYATLILGFIPDRHEGKVTGLAAYGDPQKAKPVFSQRIIYEPRRLSFYNKGRWGPAEIDLLTQSLKGYSREDIAAGVQSQLEEVVVAYVKDFVHRTGEKKIALAGGVFANVKLNQRLREMKGVEDVYIHPHMGDGGLGLGSALALWARKKLKVKEKPLPFRLKDVYWGREFKEEEIEKALKVSGFVYQRYEDIEDKIADSLAQGKIVAVCRDSMEYGPRALGNRSILYTTTDKTVNDWLNKKLKRTEFMPFAPSILEDRVKDYFQDAAAKDYAARFMTITYDVTPLCREKAPAIVHVDGTARPQFVSRDEHPFFYKVISEYEKRTGLPLVINTSFNIHEEPIVCTPEDSLKAFEESRLDELALGPYLVTRKT